ncbi:MAG: hypothetical protein A2Y89_05895 [Chloroflexi bacterium RBG_13_51_18]|nr:MAG: hypothetical protein A2Y89_05895 [Chloroflexi bacterium RBG_13_51_18]
MRKVTISIRIRRYLVSLALVALLFSIVFPSSPVLAAPVVTLTPSSGAVGTTITITGTVFDSYQGDNIHVFFDTTEIENSPLIVPPEGTFSVSFIIPATAAAGKHSIRIKSEVGLTILSMEDVFTVVAATLSLDILEGNVGTTVIIAGSGFYVDKPLTLYYMNLSLNQIGSEIATSAGKFSHQFVIPIGPAGYHNITAVNEYGNHAEIQFKVLPDLKLNLDSAGAGELVNASGTGYTSRTVVTIIFGSVGVTVAQTDDFGSFDIDFYVPSLKPMSYDVRAQDSFGNTDTTQFTISAGANLSESIGATGSELTINGSGFIPGHTITVYYDDIPIALALADNNGDFTATFTVPPGGGDHIITVSDGSNTKKYNFSLEKEPPPVPVLLLPNDESMTKAEAFFDWNDVADASLPVSYNLEVASDLNFASVVVYKVGINASQYALTDNEILSASFKNAPYFWRIKAVDGAGNEGEYSEPWVFYISVPSTPDLYLPMTDAEVELPIHFSWQSAASLSTPITYNLQIAATPDFIAPLLNKTGLSASEYLVSDADETQLEKNNSYFWRVQAVDNARNAGEWAAVGSFYFITSSGFPGWATIILIIIGFFIGILLAFRIGRRTAYH